jgi:hypothetical protein
MQPPDKSPEDPAVAGSSGLSVDELERQICQLAGHIAAATCRWLMLLAEFDDRNGWWGWGTKSCAHWLSWRCSLAPRTAREHLRVAHRLQELPLVRERFAAGQLSYCKVRALTRVASPENERSFVEIACHATGAQVAKLTRGYAGALSATLETAEHAHDYRNLDWSWEDDGSLRMSVRLPAEDAAVVLAAIKAAEEEAIASGAAPDPTQTMDAHPAGARRADALVSVARSALAADKAQRPSADPCEFVVHVDAESLAGDRIADRCEVEDGPALAPETARRLGCDAALVRIVEKDGKPMTVSRRKRLISPALRRALRSRDGGCRFPGCDHKRFIHAHHVQHWARGGPTTINNLVQLCSFHHRLVHEGGFRVERAGRSSFRFRRPDGRVINPSGPSRLRGPGLEQQNQACSLNIDDRTCRPLSAGDPLDYGLAVEILLRRLFGPDPPRRGTDPGEP